MPADAQTAGINDVHAGQSGVGRNAAAGTVRNGVSRSIGGVTVVEKGQVGEIHQQTVTFAAADFHKSAVLYTVLTKVDGVVYITPVQQSGVAGAVTVFIQCHDHHAAAGKLNGVGGTGFAVILIAVKHQNTGSRGLRGSVIRDI